LRPFDRLTALVGAIVQFNSERVAALMDDDDGEALIGVAVRHKCAGMIVRAVTESGRRAPRWTTALRRVAALALSDNIALMKQAAIAAAALEAARLDHAFLKGLARLRAGDTTASFTHHYDIDILIRPEAAEAAERALIGIGYVEEFGAPAALWYRSHHHHLVPLVIMDQKPVELHVAFAPAKQFGITTNWAALRSHIVRREDTAHEWTLDPLARAVHVMVHGLKSGRLYDFALLAMLLRDHPTLAEELRAWLGTAVSHPAISVAFAAANRLRGAETAATRKTLNYLRWIDRREDLPAWLRARAHFVDAWHTNGGTLFGAATRESVARLLPLEKPTPAAVTLLAARTAGRAAASLAAAAITGLR
jgi:hypothetical protein